MAKGPIITPQVEALIASIYEEHPKWKAPKVRYEAISVLHRNDRSLPEDWPSLSIVQKVLAKVRKEAGKTNPKDAPWSLGSLIEYPIPPEALPAVTKIYKELDPWSPFMETNYGSLTVREALWVARLYKIIDDPDLFLDWAYQYAVEERYSEIMGKPLNTFELDDFLLNVPQEMVKGSHSSRKLARYYFYSESSNTDK